MGLLTIAYKNLKKNFSFYSLYFVSVAFVLMVFFSFISFAMNDIIMEKISSDGRVETMSKTVAVFVMAFVLFYMSYSNSFFLKRRTKELGIYSLLGYRKSSMLKLLTIENVVICLLSLLTGVILGAILHKGIIEVIIRVLKLQIETSAIPLFNYGAILFTLAFVFAVLIVLFLSNWVVLRNSSILNLVRMEKREEKKMKVRMSLSIVGLLFMVLGYILAFDITRGVESLWKTIGFSPMALLTMLTVVIGTIFFIHSFLPFSIHKLEQRKNWLYKEMNIIVLPNFKYKIRSKAKTLILLTLLAAGTLSLFASTVLSIYYPVAATERIIPSAIEFPIEDKGTASKAIEIVKGTNNVENMKYSETTIIQIMSSSANLPFEYNVKEVSGFDLISESDYKELIELQNRGAKIEKLKDDEAILVKYRPEEGDPDKGNVYSLNLSASDNAEVIIKETTLLNPIGFANSIATLIISDTLYQKIKTFGLPEKTIMSIDGQNMRDNKEVYENLEPLFKDDPYFASSYQRNEVITQENSSTFLLIAFVTIIFFVATGSILYFHNISSIMADKDDLMILNRMGYNNKMMKKIISKQILALFSIPYVLGITHSTFTIIAYKSALMDDLLGRNSAFILPVLVTVVIFTIVYIIYYVVTKRACYKVIFTN
ncbi:FtsX-like permease family protein [Lysinibacillus pakistanensis]|uniref:FtsX-like permease family protein n=1 Tax=Lysinibacillus pakistanensis TaxID=759811 RepID=A0ABX6DF24_9BACI|nr:FtsX-like permease family protein [Lysinibacillus pakistanensis]